MENTVLGLVGNSCLILKRHWKRLKKKLSRDDYPVLTDEDTWFYMSTAVPLSVIFHLWACAYRQRVSSMGCNSVLKSLVRHAYIPIIVSAPGTRQQRANRMTLKYLSPASLWRIKFGVRGNLQQSSTTLCGRVCACIHKTQYTHKHAPIMYVLL